MDNTNSEPQTPWPILPCGDSSLTIQLGDVIAPAIGQRVLAFDRAIHHAREQGLFPGILDVVPCYTSVSVHYNCSLIGFADLAEQLKHLLAQAVITDMAGRHWRVPAFYGEHFDDDLEAVAHLLNLSADDVVARHLGSHFQIAMIGFTPGFAYLSGLDPVLNISRRATPRPHAPAGSLSIAAGQAAIQCLASPTGWHVIGRTPVRNFDPHRNPAFLFEPGDIVSFFAADSAMWNEMESAANAGEMIAELATPNTLKNDV